MFPKADVDRIRIVVLTFRRPGDLAEALPLVLGQAEALGSHVDVLVIDNDPTGSAGDFVRGFAGSRLGYVLEPLAGISAARNRALIESPDIDLLVFIDDDERPRAGWLEALVRTYGLTQPAVVAGAVVSTFAEDEDPWVRAGEFFIRRRLATGTPITLAATNNLLLDLRQIRGLGLTFNEEFGQSGGSDTLFSRQLVSRGGSMVWCDEAVVVDVVPKNRMTRGWVLRRAFRAGNTWARTSIFLADSPTQKVVARVRLLGQAAPRAMAGALRMVWGTAVRSARHQARGARTVARGAGMAAGALGVTFHEYKRVSQPTVSISPRSESASAHPDGMAR